VGVDRDHTLVGARSGRWLKRRPLVPRPIRKHVLDDRDHIPLQLRTTGVMHLYWNFHTQGVRQPAFVQCEVIFPVSKLHHF